MITQAFILGAGLGTRLRPLTDVLPKPLVPLFHKPLAMWAVEACEAVGCMRFAINTHHLPEKWKGFGEGRDVTFFHEGVLLETGGGLKNIEGKRNFHGRGVRGLLQSRRHGTFTLRILQCDRIHRAPPSEAEETAFFRWMGHCSIRSCGSRLFRQTDGEQRSCRPESPCGRPK